MPIAASMFSFDLFGLTRHRQGKMDTKAVNAPSAVVLNAETGGKHPVADDKDRDRSDYHPVILGGFFPIL